MKARRPGIIWYAAGCLVFWLLLILARLPGPCIDDLFFVGPAVNLARGGFYTNPWVPAWNAVMSSGLFFFHPPYYSYVLAGWLKIFGLSTLTLVVFQNMWGFVFSMGAGGVLARYGVPGRAIWLVPVVFALSLPAFGLRPEAMTFALLASGLFLLSLDLGWAVFAGFFLIGSSVLTHTASVAYAIPLTAAILWKNWHESSDHSARYLGPRLGALVLAFVLTTLLFLIAIDFKLSLFLHDYLTHAALRRPPSWKAPLLFLRHTLEYWGYLLTLPTYLLFVAMLFLAWRNGRKAVSRRVWVMVLGCLAGMVFNIFLDASSSTHYIWLLSWLLIPALWIYAQQGMTPRSKWLGWSIVVAVLVVSQTNSIIPIFFNQRWGKTENYGDIRTFVKENPDKNYAIDCVVAYQVLDYRLPKNTVSLDFITGPAEAPIHSISQKQPDCVWIGQTYMLKHFLSDFKEEAPRLKITGRSFNSMARYPNEVTFLP